MQVFKKIATRFFQPRQSAGLEIRLSADQHLYRLVLLKNQKGSIETQLKDAKISSMQALQEKIPAGTAVHLCLYGRGILHKHTPQSGLSNIAALQKVLPNADPQQFYIQQKAAVNGSYVSIARKDLIDDLLKELEQQQLAICGLSFGPFDIQQLLPLLSEQQHISTQEQLLTFDTKGQLLQLSSTETTAANSITLGDEQWNSALLPAYASALNGLLSKTPSIGIPAVQSARNELFHRQLFYSGGVFIMAFFMFLLLLNTFGYYWYKGENEKMQMALLHSRSQLEQLDTMKNQIDRQQQLLNASGILQQSRTSFYADRIAVSLPKELNLVQLDIFPKEKEKSNFDSDEELTRYSPNTIRLKGRCKSSLTYNEWIKTLQAMDWIAAVQHMNYKDLSARLGEFEIQITTVP